MYYLLCEYIIKFNIILIYQNKNICEYLKGLYNAKTFENTFVILQILGCDYACISVLMLDIENNQLTKNLSKYAKELIILE